jgi:succinyl-CoA--D-citramalate CoA-transferase
MGRSELAVAGRFQSDDERGARQEEIDDIVGAWTSQLRSEDVLERMRSFAVPASLIYRAPEMLADPHFAARSSIIEMRDAVLGTIKMHGVFPRLSATPGSVRWTGPALGEHNHEVLCELLGLSLSQVADLQRQGVV